MNDVEGASRQREGLIGGPDRTILSAGGLS